MVAATLARTTVEGFASLSRWERVAWLVRAERELHRPPAGGAPGKFDADALLRWTQANG